MNANFTKNGYRTKWGWKNSILDFFDIIAFLIFIAWIAWVIRFFIFMPYTVEWSSMADTFHDKDFIVVDKITPKYGELKRWDVVVFIPPGKDIPFIKRIIGLPGETVKLYGGKTYVCQNEEQDVKDCTKLDEKYLGNDVSTEARCGVSTFKVESGFLVFWDNRGFSTDSRCCFGLWCVGDSEYTIQSNRIIGKVFRRLFPSPMSFTNENTRYTNN